MLHVVCSIWELEPSFCYALELKSSSLKVFESCCWLFIVGCWLLFVGCWLVVGCGLLLVVGTLVSVVVAAVSVAVAVVVVVVYSCTVVDVVVWAWHLKLLGDGSFHVAWISSILDMIFA